ncbi:GtrA family protein [Clostridium sp. NSJ-6]|uniref:GtrA family protein n=1 Tax=Clostridium hominis TaxID=2763036 RepID=A0ABR7D9S7_9CLOT|nr:GtrA family protein [Clostridium hominis]MBC5628087.1 GtrA family protein [Clostridium hominis]
MNFLSDDLFRFIKFALVGVLNTLMNWIIFFILNASGFYYLVANIISYSISTLNSYLWNSRWVFKYQGDNKKETTLKFIVLNIFGLVLNTIILFVLVDKLKLNKMVGLIITTAIVMIINYMINKFWVFRGTNS